MSNVNAAQVEKFIKGVDYPVSKENLIKHAQKNGADEQVRATLEQLPNQSFESSNDVTKAVTSLAERGKSTPR